MRAHDHSANADDGQKAVVSDAVVHVATTTLGMLADGTRLRLMVHLMSSDMDVTALTAAVGAARPAVSQHLGKLRLAGLEPARSPRTAASGV